MIGVCSPPNVFDGTLPWTVNESNLNSLASDPEAYLTPLLTDANGDWKLIKIFSLE